MARRKVTQVDDIEIEVSVPKVVDDALLLKVDHTHAGTLYKKGTSIDELNPSDSTLEFMKARDIV